MKTKALTILIIDDAPANILLLGELLSGQGYKVLTATRGARGREIAHVAVPDLILLDVMMPEEDGFETCIRLKEDPVTIDIPVVFISAADDTDSKVHGLSIGGWDYISKPFQPAEVLVRVKNYLKLRLAFLKTIEEQALRLQQIQDAQQTILVDPEQEPASRCGVRYLPILEAGGDFYDLFAISDDIYVYFVADISGHDLGASFVTSALKALVRQNSSLLNSPDETVRMMNRILTTILDEDQHLTAVYTCLDRRQGKLRIVNAGHVPTLLLDKDGTVKRLEPDGDIMGAFDNGFFNCQEIDVVQGQRFILFTDGLIESMKLQVTRQQGLGKLESLCIRTRELPVQEAVTEIVQAMLPAGQEVEDDVVLLGVDV